MEILTCTIITTTSMVVELAKDDEEAMVMVMEMALDLSANYVEKSDKPSRDVTTNLMQAFTIFIFIFIFSFRKIKKRTGDQKRQQWQLVTVCRTKMRHVMLSRVTTNCCIQGSIECCCQLSPRLCRLP